MSKSNHWWLPNWFWNEKPPRPVTVTDTIDDAQWVLLTTQEHMLLYAIEKRQLGRTDDAGFQKDLADWRKGVRFSVGLGTPKGK